LFGGGLFVIAGGKEQTGDEKEYVNDFNVLQKRLVEADCGDTSLGCEQPCDEKKGDDFFHDGD
jgi:hypothetical protein